MKFISNHINLSVVIAALLVTMPRLTLAFLTGDNIHIQENWEITILVITGIGAGVVLTIGNAVIAHGLASNYEQRDSANWKICALSWVTFLLGAVIIVSPSIMIELNRSDFSDVLTTEFSKWVWSIAAVIIVEILVAAAMISKIMTEEGKDKIQVENENTAMHERNIALESANANMQEEITALNNASNNAQETFNNADANLHEQRNNARTKPDAILQHAPANMQEHADTEIAIMRAIKIGDARTQASIAEYAQVNASTVSRKLKTMQEENKVYKLGHGKGYEIDATFAASLNGQLSA